MEINLVAIDEASSVVETAASNMQTGFGQMKAGTSGVSSSFAEMAGGVQTSASGAQTATEGLGTAVEKSSASFSSAAMSMNTLAMSGMGLYNAYDRIETSSVALDAAHVKLEKSTNAVQSAQEAYNKTVEKSGVGSQAEIDAGNRLHAAQEAQQVAVERLDLAQGNYSQTLVSSAMTVIPSLVGIMGTLNTMHEASTFATIAHTVATGAHTIATGLQTAATTLASGAMAVFNAIMDANPIMIVVLAITGLVAVLAYLYNTCEPVRNVINALWEIISGAFLGAINALGRAWDWLTGIAAGFKSVIDAVTGAVGAVTDFFGGLANSLLSLSFVHAGPQAEAFNRTLDDSITKTDTLTRNLSPLREGLMGTAGGLSINAGGGGGTTSMTVNPTITIGNIDRNTRLQDVTDAVNAGIGQALFRRNVRIT